MKVASKEFVIKKMSELMITPKKKYSQNFLTDYAVVEKAIDALQVQKDEQVIEIGPGLGALSQEILDRGFPLDAYEIDEDMASHLKEYFKSNIYPNFNVERIDFLKVNLNKYEGKKVKFISNIPYNITSDVIEKIVTSPLDVKCFEFMVQKEVYDRIKSKVNTKDYGPLNIFIDYVGTLSVVQKVPAKSFIPSPNVDSIILMINFNKERNRNLEKEFIQITKASFNMRRKTILNNLQQFFKNKEKANSILVEAGIDGTRRGESLSKEEFLKLARAYKNNL